jgi:hypothetical protein
MFPHNLHKFLQHIEAILVLNEALHDLEITKYFLVSLNSLVFSLL